METTTTLPSVAELEAAWRRMLRLETQRGIAGTVESGLSPARSAGDDSRLASRTYADPRASRRADAPQDIIAVDGGHGGRSGLRRFGRASVGSVAMLGLGWLGLASGTAQAFDPDEVYPDTAPAAAPTYTVDADRHENRPGLAGPTSPPAPPAAPAPTEEQPAEPAGPVGAAALDPEDDAAANGVNSPAPQPQAVVASDEGATSTPAAPPDTAPLETAAQAPEPVGPVGAALGSQEHAAAGDGVSSPAPQPQVVVASDEVAASSTQGTTVASPQPSYAVDADSHEKRPGLAGPDTPPVIPAPPAQPTPSGSLDEPVPLEAEAQSQHLANAQPPEYLNWCPRGVVCLHIHSDYEDPFVSELGIIVIPGYPQPPARHFNPKDPHHLGAYPETAKAHDQASSWVNDSDDPYCAFDIKDGQAKLLWVMNPRDSNPWVGEDVNDSVDYIQYCGDTSGPGSGPGADPRL